jgi:hypothetical protein
MNPQDCMGLDGSLTFGKDSQFMIISSPNKKLINANEEFEDQDAKRLRNLYAELPSSTDSK